MEPEFETRSVWHQGPPVFQEGLIIEFYDIFGIVILGIQILDEGVAATR